MLCLLLVLGAAQAAAEVPITPQPRRLGVADGLPSANINAFAEDRRGYMWLASHDGLARFDGRNFRIWRAEDGLRRMPFSGSLYIEQDDFAEVPPPRYFRLSPGREVRLRGAYFVTATDCVKNEQGEVIEVLATYDPATRGGDAPDGRKVKSTMHWVSAAHAVDASVALYERLFTTKVPGEETGEALDDLNPNSRTIVTGCKVEPVLAEAAPGEVVQFERTGYFAADVDQPMLFHRTVGLRDEWANLQKKQG